MTFCLEKVLTGIVHYRNTNIWVIKLNDIKTDVLKKMSASLSENFIFGNRQTQDQFRPVPMYDGAPVKKVLAGKPHTPLHSHMYYDFKFNEYVVKHNRKGFKIYKWNLPSVWFSLNRLGLLIKSNRLVKFGACKRQSFYETRIKKRVSIYAILCTLPTRDKIKLWGKRRALLFDQF